jgi:hypothetical protein
MNKVFVVKNQHGLYLSKQQEWISGAERQALFRSQHRDEAINTVFEASSRDIYLRAETLACEVDAKNNPLVDVAQAATDAQAELQIDAAANDTGAVAEHDAPDPEHNNADISEPAAGIETPPDSPHLSER